MTTATRTPTKARTTTSKREPPPETAAVWIDDRRAMVARTGDGGEIWNATIDRAEEIELAYLARVVHAIGDRRRVAILGPGPLRLALEREYVAIVHRPDRLVDVEHAEAMSETDLVERLRGLDA